MKEMNALFAQMRLGGAARQGGRAGDRRARAPHTAPSHATYLLDGVPGATCRSCARTLATP